jgi:hypothetical protein
MPHVPPQCGQLKSAWCVARTHFGMVLLLIGREACVNRQQSAPVVMLDAGGRVRMLPGAEEALALAMIWRCQMRRCDAARRHYAGFLC